MPWQNVVRVSTSLLRAIRFVWHLSMQSVRWEISRRGWLAVQPRNPTIVYTSDSGHGAGPYAADYETIFGGKGHVSAINPDESGFTTLCKDDRDGLARVTVACLARSPDHPFSLVASFVNPHDICHPALRGNMPLPLSSPRKLIVKPHRISTGWFRLSRPQNKPCSLSEARGLVLPRPLRVLC